jgi:hypothetical protein
MIMATVWTVHKYTWQRNLACVHLDCRCNCFMFRHHTSCHFYFSTISKRTVRYSSILCGVWRSWPHFPPHAVCSTHLWKLLLATTWSASRHRNGYFGVPTTATDYSTSDSHLGIYVVFEQYTIVWDATWSSRPMTRISETFKMYWPVTEEYVECEASGYRWWGLHHCVYKFIRLRNI